ncbi:MAG: hypothetical protein M3Z13_05505 [Candidatus Dormibacteraeota bacterium]|nr:hypothetical protein [Candidatus Dormibacteraeota bacterium]
MSEVDPALRRWFIVHFVIDWLTGLPLLAFPAPVLGFLGWHPIDPTATRLFAAALLGIGGQSFIGRNAGVGEYRAMLNLKLIWSGAACVGLAVSLLEGAPWLAAVALAVFLAFFALWAYYRRLIR